ncbi:MATE family efflux transporter [Halobellus inordinatus]|uniref:MATE family efflux transporter n=1 Tax=Halobellus inordinatus TaxID=1126236 RepID=UPI00210A82BD|nr:MATE family efflux transporter [Halobellus inordinatus]
MRSRLWTVLQTIGTQFAKALEHANIVERSRLQSTLNLSWPRIVTGIARMSQQTADLAMVGTVLGPPAIAGLAFAYAYWQIGNRVSLGLSGGAISLVSQYFGADNIELANRTIGQSYVLAAVISLPLTGVYLYYSSTLVGLLGGSPEAIGYGSTYLSILAPALFFEYCNKVASRVFAAIGDTLTPMVIRAGGAVINIVVNVFLIFGFELGVIGAAIGTLVATVTVTIVFLWGLLGLRYPIRQPVPIRISFAGGRIDLSLLRSLIRVSGPLMFQEVARAIVVFPLLAIAAVYGSTVVAAFEVARRVRGLVNSPAWGFSMAASSLVGRHLGANEIRDATQYGIGIFRLTIVTFVLIAVVVISLSSQIANVFVDDPNSIEVTALFIRIAAIASIGLGIDKAATGVLRGAGDTHWLFYATIVGLYLVSVPVAYIGVITPLGVSMLYLALLLETFVPAAITSYRFRLGVWQTAGYSYRQQTDQPVE